MVRWLIASVLGLAAMVTVEAGDAAACDRSPSPMETRAVGVALADLVVTADVTAIDGDVATAAVQAFYKGDALGVSAGDAIRIKGVTGADDGRDCGVHSIVVGRRYVFLLWKPAGAVRDFQLIDPMGGVDEIGASTNRLYVEAAAAAYPVSAPSIDRGVQSWLMLGPEPDAGEIDLIVLVRNVGAGPLRWRYRSWPRATQSRCTLDLVDDATGHAVAPRPVPISAADIRSYFARHGPRYDLTLARGASQMLLLDRVTTAASGWGYKEQLGFVFYPPAGPGPHTVRATCLNLIGRKLTTAPVHLRL